MALIILAEKLESPAKHQTQMFTISPLSKLVSQSLSDRLPNRKTSIIKSLDPALMTQPALTTLSVHIKSWKVLLKTESPKRQVKLVLGHTMWTINRLFIKDSRKVSNLVLHYAMNVVIQTGSHLPPTDTIFWAILTFKILWMKKNRWGRSRNSLSAQGPWSKMGN